MDYKQLLYKYIMHVDMTEGIDFTNTLNDVDVNFTDHEIKELKKLSKKLRLFYENGGHLINSKYK